ncbi:transcription factor IIA, alpha/beta subunit [Apodospora peruviana]|uniref:Transcription initiation factor IIA large subunit n=1 Tax=Apodospora peruviana TaxID=516989 RepID=A0AAE0MFT8_9PEZI|nr:transcription factor IIA, alpha/beta subunit [Apodospora peruviana]
MSNSAVGQVYDHIIQEVINAVRVDFEENGVDDSVLDELKKGWQHGLSQLNVAQFPWDPKPEPPQAAAPQVAHPPPPAATHPSVPAPAASYTQSTLSPQTSAQPLSLPGGHHQVSNGVTIKSEPGYVKAEPAIKQEPGANGSQPPSAGPPFNAGATPGSMAQQRAAAALGARYGDRAAASIHAIHAGSASASQPGQQGPQQAQQQVQQAQQQGPPQYGQVPQQRQQQMSPQQQYKQGVAAAMQQRLQPQGTPPQNGLPAAQVDGPSDGYEGVLMQRDAHGRSVEMGRVEIDNHLHAQIAARAKQMEGGGLMLPITEATRHRSIAKKHMAAGGPSQVDGPDDDIKDEDEIDEDAINSDLDDSDDGNHDADEEEDDAGHMMLCMYDKVQRVKNKWKCTLKDGVLTVNGKEYVFHKATGEYEW